jgi:ABC-2 type transport system permease protein
MKRYIKIYLKLLQLSWASLLTYRSNFINSVIASLVWGFFNLLVIVFLTAKTSSVFGWTRDELIILVASANILLGIFYFLFSFNFQNFSQIVNLGKLDSILLKPIDNQFAISLWQASFQSISRVIFGICVLTYMLMQIHAHISPLQGISFFFLLIFGILLQYSIWFSVLTITIWLTTLSNLSDLLYNTNDLIRFPAEMFRQGKEFLYFIIFPFTLIVIVPVKVLLQKVTFLDIFCLLFFASTFFYLSRKFFTFALRFYTSASG